ncbi:MAG TPA: methyltransferase domain-containing protein [Phycisphaerae bacterium]|nr:methyltransferase domain-containing protein [Phycisphaerae bacterium]
MNHVIPSSSTPGKRPVRLHELDMGATKLRILAPADPDSLLDDPQLEDRYHADNYLPYWPIIWPSALMLAEFILKTDQLPSATRGSEVVMDLGCGLGIVGISAALRGWKVEFTDYDPEAVQFAEYNARGNGIPADRITAYQMDWRQPVDKKFDWIIGSDVLYERRLHPLFLGAVEKLLAPNGVVWIADPRRTSAEDFPVFAAQQGFRVHCEELPWTGEPGLSKDGLLMVLQRVATHALPVHLEA